MLPSIAEHGHQAGSLAGHEGQIPKATRRQVNAHQATTKPVGSTAQVVIEVTHGRTVTGPEVEHGLALTGQQERRVSLGSQQARPEFRTVRVPATVLLAGELAQRFAVNCGARHGISGPQGSSVKKDGRGQVLRASLPSFFSAAHVNTLSTAGRWVLVGLTEVVHALFHLGHLVFAPSLAFEGVDLGSDADLPGEHSSDFPSHPTG